MTLEEFNEHKSAGTLHYVWDNKGSQRRVRLNGSLFTIPNHIHLGIDEREAVIEFIGQVLRRERN